MSAARSTITSSRRHFLLGAAAACVPFASMGSVVYTPHELREQYEREVAPRLDVPDDEVRLYGGITEMQLYNLGRELPDPQYLLVIDGNPHVQAAMLFWRLLPGSYQLVGASPVSTAAAEPASPQGLFEQARGVSTHAACARTQCDRGMLRVYDFGWQHTTARIGASPNSEMRLQVRAADRQAERRLGAPCEDGCILLPSRLISFLDEYGVLDDGVSGRVQRHVLPYRGRHLMVVDSERDERPPWSPAPPVLEQRAAVARVRG